LEAQHKHLIPLATWENVGLWTGQVALEVLNMPTQGPFAWEKNDFSTAGAIILGTGALYAF